MAWPVCSHLVGMPSAVGGDRMTGWLQDHAGERLRFLRQDSGGEPTMSTLAAERTSNMVTTKDGTQIYYKDWGKGPVVTFSHGWPLNADAWDAQMLYLTQNGYRTVAHDRRGHGRSSQSSSGNEMNTYADDLATLIEAL